MDKTKYITVIQKYFPDISDERLTFFNDGWDHYVFVVDKKKAFRFPKTEQDGNKDEVETKFFETFADTSPVPVQKMELQNDSLMGHYQMYDFIDGTGFTKELASTFSEDELDEIATLLGDFFTTLHAFPLEKAQQMHMDSIVNAEDYASYWEGFLQKIQQNFSQYFSKDESLWIENIFEEYIQTVHEHPYDLKVTHFDILPEHILVNEKTHQLAGILDFSLRISDPAYDFSYLDRYGEKFLQKVLDNYPPSKTDPTFLVRRRFYAARLGFSFLAQAVERQPENVDTIVNKIHQYITDRRI